MSAPINQYHAEEELAAPPPAQPNLKEKVAGIREKFRIRNIARGISDRVRKTLEKHRLGRAALWMKERVFSPSGEESGEESGAQKPAAPKASAKEQLQDELKRAKAALDQHEKGLNPFDREELAEQNRIAQDTIDLMSALRRKAGLKVLRRDEKLSTLATARAWRCADEQRIEHDAAFIKSEGIGAMIGEMLATGFSSAREAVEAFRTSLSSHPRYVWSKTFDRIGIGVRKGKDNKYYMAVYLSGGSPESEGEKLPSHEQDAVPDEFREYSDLADMRKRSPLLREQLKRLEDSVLKVASPPLAIQFNRRATDTLAPELRRKGALGVNITDGSNTVVYSLLEHPPHFERPVPDQEKSVSVSFSEVKEDFQKASEAAASQPRATTIPFSKPPTEGPPEGLAPAA